jgi:hypothetical protein
VFLVPKIPFLQVGVFSEIFRTREETDNRGNPSGFARPEAVSVVRAVQGASVTFEGRKHQGKCFAANCLHFYVNLAPF